jgi:tRNA(Ile)-lysidine synthase
VVPVARKPAWNDVLDEKLLRQLVHAGDTVLAAVSGGPDSIALLVALAEARGVLRFRLVACYVDHGMRPAAAKREAEHVANMCRELAVDFYERRIPSLASAPPVGSLEGKLRHLRYGVLREVAAESGADFVALGHTADDLVESFLMHLIRGMALRGAVFSPHARYSGLKILRPLWRTSRRQVVEFLQTRGVVAMTDESNADTRITRNKVRHELLPLLRQFNPGIGETLTRTASRWAEADRLVRRRATVLVRAAQSRSQARHGGLAVHVLAREISLVRREALALWLERKFSGRVLRVTSDYEGVEGLLERPPGRFVVLRRGVVVARASHDLFSCRLPEEACAGGEAPHEVVLLSLATEYAKDHPTAAYAFLPDATELTVVRDAESGALDCGGRLLNLVGAPIVVRARISLTGVPPLQPPFFMRNRQHGDRVGKSKRLKEVLSEAGIPFFLRDFLVLLVDSGGKLLGVWGYPRLTREILRRSGLEGEIVLTAVPDGEGTNESEGATLNPSDTQP